MNVIGRTLRTIDCKRAFDRWWGLERRPTWVPFKVIKAAHNASVQALDAKIAMTR